MFRKPSSTSEHDINAVGNDHLTPLLRACRNGDTDEVERLLAYEDIDVNKADISGLTPLQWAVFKGYTAIVHLLLAVQDRDKPAEKTEDVINAFDKDGLTPLLRASRYGDTDEVKRLLAHKDIDVNKADILGMTPLHWAAFKGYLEIVEMLLAVKDINIGRLSRHGQPIIRCAAGNGHAKVAKLLASHGAAHFNYSFGTKIIPTLGSLNKDTEKAIRDGHQLYNSKMRSAILFMLCFLRAENPKNKEYRESNLSRLNRNMANIILQHITGYETNVFLTKLRQFPNMFSQLPTTESRKRKRNHSKDPSSSPDDETPKSVSSLKRCKR